MLILMMASQEYDDETRCMLGAEINGGDACAHTASLFDSLSAGGLAKAWNA